jgi:WS/DGAT C-terminal domain
MRENISKAADSGSTSDPKFPKKCSFELPKEAIINVVINLRNPPQSIQEMRAAGNQLHYHIVKFPLVHDFKASLMRIKEQLDDFKNSNKLYFLYTAMYFVSALAPKFVNDFLLNDVMRKGTKISITNICGPEEPLQFGASGAKSEAIMFANYYEENFLQITVFSHCGQLRMGINVGKMNINAQKLMKMVDNKFHELIEEFNLKDK